MMRCGIHREGWADYFEQHQIQYAFFSAANGIALQEERARLEELALLDSIAEGSDEDSDEEHEDDFAPSGMVQPKSGNKLKAAIRDAKNTTQSATGGSHPITPMANRPIVRSRDEESESESESEEGEDKDVDELTKKMRRGAGISLPGSDEAKRTRILSVLELEDLFLSHAPEGEFEFISLSAFARLTRLVFSLAISYWREDGSRTRRISQRRKIFNHQCFNRRKESISLGDTGKDQASTNSSTLARSTTLRLSRIGVPSIRSYESRSRRRWSVTD